MPHCENCDEHVPSEFVRVFGIDGKVPVCTYRSVRDNVSKKITDAL